MTRRLLKTGLSWPSVAVPGHRTCYRNAEAVAHRVDYALCDCLRTELPSWAQAMGSGRLMSLFPVALHQKECGTSDCGGEFVCDGCSRLVGWCMGAADSLGEEHCDECYCDRLAVLEGVKRGFNTRFLLNTQSKKKGDWKRKPEAVAEELRADGFLEFKGNGTFALTERGLVEVEPIRKLSDRAIRERVSAARAQRTLGRRS